VIKIAKTTKKKKKQKSASGDARTRRKTWKIIRRVVTIQHGARICIHLGKPGNSGICIIVS